MALLESLVAASPILAIVIAAGVALLSLMLVVVALAAALHPDRAHRADARRVLTALLNAFSSKGRS